ncbi:hypothetical protein B566_EDAN004705 [Ephemera danica]|nr:hypothetical protein B566_EDAN004705 [Ephemera danica]
MTQKYSEILRDYRDGDIYKSVYENEDCDGTVCNPLGAAKTKHKMLGVYYIIGNLPAVLRSLVENINLAMLYP